MVNLNYKAKPEYVKAKTAVWWDIDTCPVPDGYDGRRIRPSIERALKELDYFGPVTITAIGNLKKAPAHLLPELASTGIDLKHAVSDEVGGHIFDELFSFKDRNPPPATIMIISDKVEAELSFHLCRDQQIRRGYNFLLARTYTTSMVSVLYSDAEWVWKSLLEADKQETRHVLRKCSASGGSASFSCKSCSTTRTCLVSFIKHLGAKGHALEESEIIRCRMMRRAARYGNDLVRSKTKAKRRGLKKAFRTDFRLLPLFTKFTLGVALGMAHEKYL